MFPSAGLHGATPHPVLLRTLSLFEEVPDVQLESMAPLLICRTVTRNAMLVRAGSCSEALYCILTGSVRVRAQPPGDREVILAILVPGDIFGEAALFGGEPYSADYVAREPCDLLVCPPTAFPRLLAASNVGTNLMRSLTQQLRRAEHTIENLARQDVTTRVTEVLFELQHNPAGRYAHARGLTKLEIAQMIGASREMVSRVMKAAEDRVASCAEHRCGRTCDVLRAGDRAQCRAGAQAVRFLPRSA